ncbi:GDP-L-fucose synthase [Prochlorococcus marinus XMU1419]|uniref:GDP-L-fucose synthase family protein n=1 Tax=Prochlorococcus marinus TaxID=1219 RepID=UPI001AD96028|nr:GDP-L-fucose synthase [Prochlorococcus marinus]MBO8234269.1 GDP-L-fucose synthase [Prochlorococcus marinus XMU1419]MBW3075959.1 GDP-fucose synthetase [Prochlorococcus marinus str. XMU1419]
MLNYLEKNESFYVAGHNGMVGQAIVKSLLKKGYCNDKYGGKIFLNTRKDLDLTSYQNVLSWFKAKKPSIVIIAAAKVGGIYANNKYPYEFISENLKIQQNIIEAAWLSGAKRLLFLGSSCIYPKFPNLPIKEEELLGSHLEKTNEPYAIAKIAGLKLCETIRTQYGFDAISLMPTNLYGPGDNYHTENSHVLAALLKKFILAKKNNSNFVTCWGSGKPLREFLHVDDFASACIHVLEKWNPDDNYAPKKNNNEKLYYLNVGSGEEISIKELAEKIAIFCQFEGKIIWDQSKPDGTYRKNLDISRIHSLGWHSKIPLEKGIKKLIKEIVNTLANDDINNLEYLKNFF